VYDDRKNIISFVLGAIGSGQIFFAVRDAEEQAMLKVAASKTMTTKDMTACVIYLQAGRIDSEEAAEMAKELGEKIYTKQ
jgi:hypothetical protein